MPAEVSLPELQTVFKTFVLTYLHNRPRGINFHCLDRKSRSVKYAAESVHDVNKEQGIFEVEKAAEGRHTVNFGIDTHDKMPSCTCRDWQRHHVPCKHFFAVFQHRSDWPWERLPTTYQRSAYLSMDMSALDQHFYPALSEGDNWQIDEPPDEPTCIHEPSDDLPTQDTTRDEQPTSALPVRVSAIYA